MKSMETRIAEQNVDASLAQFEVAVNNLISKVEQSATKAIDTFEETKEKILLPIVIGETIVDGVAAAAREVSTRVRRNPEPYVSFAALAFGLFLCFRAVRGHRRRLGKKHSWSQLEP